MGEDIHFTQAEYGKIVIAISTPSIIKKKTDDEAEESIMEFPQGISVVQFSRESDTLTMISANYAINYEDKNIWEARGNVVGRNKKDGETIRTEYLVWNQKDGTIYSDKKVQVTTPDDIIYGEGFKSDDQFNDWQVKKVTGVISFESNGKTYVYWLNLYQRAGLTQPHAVKVLDKLTEEKHYIKFNFFN